MKKINLFVFIFLWVNCVKANPSALNDVTLTQEIHYTCKEATEVYLVWGINGWTFQDEKMWPEGTFIKGNLMYTLMKFEDGIFSTQLKVKPNTTIDYIFWITKASMNVSSDVWDLNKAPQKDYHTLTFNDNVTLIRSDKKIKPNKPLSLLDFSWPLLIIVTLLLFSFFIIKKYRYKELLLQPSPRKVILVSGCILLLALFFIRTSVLWISWDLFLHPLEFMPQLLWAGLYDHLYIVFLTIIFLLMLWPFKKFPRWKFAIAWVFIAIGLISLVAGILNIRIVEMLGKPFNYRWLYYSDFLKSADARSAMTFNISSGYIINIIVVCLAAIIMGILVICLMELLLHKYKVRKVLFTTFICLNLGYILFAQKAVGVYKWNYDKLANPVTEFLGSVNPFVSHSALFTMEVVDSLKTFDHSEKKVFPDLLPGSGKIKNVIVFVCESTPAEYLQPYGSKFNTTPTLEEYSTNSIVFENVYAHAPATNKSVVCLMASIYPWLSYTSITQEHPDVSLPTISSELKEHGYRTAFFNSGDNSFQRWNEFLACRKFDDVKDCKTHHCEKQFGMLDMKWDPRDGIDDECTGEELMSWIKKDQGKPFFTMMWTYQTHYPYYVSGPEKKYDTEDTILNRYLNAVHHSDMVLGKILDELKTNGLYESTLVVVIGDHGEAFGRHDQIAHASKIYEENLHIPCIFINPIFKNERSVVIGGMIDVAPTIMNIVGLPASKNWQGKNLFTADKNGRVYFFCPWSDYLFGYREGNMKYIYNATKETTEIYDLQSDPQETKNLASELPQKTELCSQRLAAWVQYHNKFMEAVLNPALKVQVDN